jgi:hypothetical protein
LFLNLESVHDHEIVRHVGFLRLPVSEVLLPPATPLCDLRIRMTRPVRLFSASSHSRPKQNLVSSVCVCARIDVRQCCADAGTGKPQGVVYASESLASSPSCQHQVGEQESVHRNMHMGVRIDARHAFLCCLDWCLTRANTLATFCCSFETAMMYVGIEFGVMRPMSRSFHNPARSALPSTSARDVWGLDVVRDQQQDLQVFYVLFAHFPVHVVRL